MAQVLRNSKLAQVHNFGISLQKNHFNLFSSKVWLLKFQFKMSFLGLDKVFRLFTIIRANGGIRKSLYKIYRFDELKLGALVGTDKYGNKYFENNQYFYGRNRWVEYTPSVGMEYDGSQVPAEWFGWLHYKTDTPPTVKPPVNYKWIIDHKENQSGTAGQYVPYTTTKPKIEAWVPPKKSGKS